MSRWRKIETYMPGVDPARVLLFCDRSWGFCYAAQALAQTISDAIWRAQGGGQ